MNVRKWLVGFGLFLLSFALGCSHTPSKATGPMQSSTAIPSAEGSITTRLTHNGNTGIDLKVQHMAEPQRVSPGASLYMVWVRPTTADMRVQKIGALLVNKNLDGELKTEVPYRNFQIFVTAEPSREVVRPSGDPLMWGLVQQRAE